MIFNFSYRINTPRHTPHPAFPPCYNRIGFILFVVIFLLYFCKFLACHGFGLFSHIFSFVFFHQRKYIKNIKKRWQNGQRYFAATGDHDMPSKRIPVFKVFMIQTKIFSVNRGPLNSINTK